MTLAQIPLWCAMSRLGIGGSTWLEECTQNDMSVRLSLVQCEELMASEEFLCCPFPRRHAFAFAPQEHVCGANLCPELCWCVCMDDDLFLKRKCFFLSICRRRRNGWVGPAWVGRRDLAWISASSPKSFDLLVLPRHNHVLASNRSGGKSGHFRFPL